MRAIIDALIEAGFRFEVGQRVTAVWEGSGTAEAATLNGAPVLTVLSTLKGFTPREYIAHVLGADLCAPRLDAPGSHGSGLPFGLCADPDLALPCAVLLGRLSFERWEAEYRALSEGVPSAYAENYERIERYIGPDPIGRLRALYEAQSGILDSEQPAPELVPMNETSRSALLVGDRCSTITGGRR